MIGDIDKEYTLQGLRIIGVDEAGRGPLCGPVVVAAVSLFREIDGINDSKKLTDKARRGLVEKITAGSVWQVYSVLPCVIDSKNILQATLWGMRKAAAKVFSRIEGNKIVLIDGNKLINWFPLEKALVKGDSLSLNIAAASVLAKVHRDRIMEKWDELYPDYGFAAHKGYATEEHYEILGRLGPTPIHRQSFKLRKTPAAQQTKLF